MNVMKKLLLLLMISTPAWCAAPAKVNTDAIINLSIAETWKMFSTAEGLQGMGYTNAAMSLQINGKLNIERAVNAQSEMIDGVITSYDPEHMLSWQWNSASCWSVLYFNAMGNDMTQIQWTDFCAESKSADLMLMQQHHRNLFDQLVRRYAPECHVCKEEREAAKH